MSLQSLDVCTRESLDAARAMAALVDRQSSSSEFAAARERFMAAMRSHHATTDAVLLAPLRESDDCAHHAMARRATEQDLARRELVAEHFAAWPAEAIRADAPRYRRAVRQLLRMLERRNAYQEQVLLPMAMEALAMRREAA
ncbi:hypothetical protein [Sphingomonas pokkalii]|uniref:Hemerythrin-like domain-containing protein n=1 Tax=Sphingomonas pokkalii TaxID=2175090 RepID=A0A2U0SB21_9SPHN|nr:hypothetical protein [Sphingomonas pokkalii]PVX28556.1 hypothetical protein DD559_03730 [Sphingomonas pokkalii]